MSRSGSSSFIFLRAANWAFLLGFSCVHNISDLIKNKEVKIKTLNPESLLIVCEFYQRQLPRLRVGPWSEAQRAHFSFQSKCTLYEGAQGGMSTAEQTP